MSENTAEDRKGNNRNSFGKFVRGRNINQLKERVKELNCLYGLTKIVRDDRLTIDQALIQIVNLIPPSWQYPDITCARLVIDNSEYKTENYIQTAWKQKTDIISEEKKIGFLEVSYLEERPDLDEGPFLNEERSLIDAIADLVGKYIDERKIKKKLEQQQKELSEAQELIKQGNGSSKFSDKKQDWEVIIDLLIKTDPRILLRITRKMVNYLYRYENEKITALLGKVCPVDRDSQSQQWCGINMPNPRQDINELSNIQQQVFEIARETLSPQELSDLFQHWVKQDKIRPLLLTSQKDGINLTEIKSELIRFFKKTDEETILAPEDQMSIKTALIRRFFTDRLEFINVAKQYLCVQDFVPLLNHIIGPSKSTGKLGGKTSGVILAEKIIEAEKEHDGLLTDVAFPKSWYLCSDTIIEFIHYNDLDEIFHHKYLDPEDIRQEQPFLEQIFKNAVFPPEIVEGLRKILRDISDDTPIIVRSSSLLEDSFGAAFSGKYKSLFVPNTGSEEERLFALMDAIAEVFASTFGPDPIEYRRERGLLDISEEMGVLIQEVVGTRAGPYYMPVYAGVAFSLNEFRWSPRIRRRDGVIRLVPGLGTRAVDRVGNDYPILTSPNRPDLQVNTLISEKIRYSPHYMDVINLETSAIETVDAVEVFKKYHEGYPILDQIVSINKQGRLATPQKFLFKPEEEDLVVTFSGLLEKSEFLVKMKHIIDILQTRINTPVDVEFASDGKKLYILQCRPQSHAINEERKPIPKNIPMKEKLFSSNRHITTGQIENIEYIVYVRPREYVNLPTREDMQRVSNIIGELNNKLPRRRFILMGPGRWGSRGDIKLGVPVNYRDINNTVLLVEIACKNEDYVPELSFGTHFFQDLVEADIKYMPLYPDEPNTIFKAEDMSTMTNHLSEYVDDVERFEHVIRLIRVSDMVEGGTLSVIMDGEVNEALAFLKSPDHWSWRMKKVKQLANQIDTELFGVKELYLIGSVKEGTAGPASDIDLIVVFYGTDEQKDRLMSWFDEQSRRLDEENKKRTGITTGGLLDVHVITEQDIVNQTSWAMHISSAYNRARRLKLGRELE